MLNLSLEQRLTELLNKVNLPVEPFRSWIINNPSGSLSYHGNNHLIEVAENGLLLSSLLGLSDQATRNIVVAGLLHDYDHTGNSTTSDAVNITRAVNYAKSVTEPLTDLNIQIKGVQDLIKATLHPSPKKPGSLNGMVIKDADALFWIKPEITVAEMVAKMEALAQETGKPVTVESTREFVNSYRFYTTPAWNLQQKSLWKRSLEEVQSSFQNN